jgi:hypothetical protein
MNPCGARFSREAGRRGDASDLEKVPYAGKEW